MEKKDIKRMLVQTIENVYWEYTMDHSRAEAQLAVAEVLADLVWHPENTYDWSD